MVENQDLRSTHYLIQNKKIYSGKARVLRSQLHTYIFYFRREGQQQKKYKALQSYYIYIITLSWGEAFLQGGISREPISRKEFKNQEMIHVHT